MKNVNLFQKAAWPMLLLLAYSLFAQRFIIPQQQSASNNSPPISGYYTKISYKNNKSSDLSGYKNTGLTLHTRIYEDNQYTDYEVAGVNEECNIIYDRSLANVLAHTSNDEGSMWTGSLAQDGAFIISGTCGTAETTEGCLEGDPGFTFPYTPSCMGMLEVADGLARVGQYSKVAVTEGTEYTFSLSESTFFITIADEEGTTVLTSGTGSVTWTAGLTGMVRYYTHLNADCGWNEETFLTKYVQCDVPIIIEEPDFPCFQGDGLASNDPETGNNIGVGENSFRTADDFIVEEGTIFTVQQVRMNVLSSMQPTEFTLNFRGNNTGSPGAIEHTVIMAPSHQRIVGEEGIYSLYEVTLSLETPLEFEAGTYWLQPEAFALVPGTSVFWELSLTGSNGAIIQTSTDHGTTWQEDSSGYQAVFFISGECSPVEEEGCFVTGTSEQWPPQTFIPSCSGAVEIISASAWAGEYSKVQVTAGTEYIFLSSVATDFITIADEDEDIAFVTGTGSVTWTSPVDQVIRFYTHVDENCTIEEITRARSVRCGDIPPPPLNDNCEDAIVLACGDSDSGSTTFATDSGGWVAPDVFYSYTGSGTPEQVTISLCGSSYDTYLTVYSDCSFSTVIAENDDFCGEQSQLSFISDGISTYIIMIEGYSTTSGDYVIDLTCSEPPVYSPCTPVHIGEPIEGAGFSGGQHAVANDFNVLAGSQFTVEKISLDVITFGGEPTTFGVSFYDGNTEVGTACGDSFSNLTPTSVAPNGIFNGSFPIYTVELTLPSVQTFPATESENKKYWVAVTGDFDSDDGFTYWSTFEYSDTTTLPTFQSTDGGATWEMYNNMGNNVEGAMLITGECQTLGLSDLNSLEFTYYPNPVKDILNIHSNKAVKNVMVHNLAGQQVMSSAKVTNGQVNISALLEGIYIFKVTLEGGQVETFKIVKK